MKKNYLKLLAIVVVSSFLFSGCANRPSPLEANIKSGNFQQVALEADKEKDLESGLDESNQLPTLYAGNSYLYSKNYKKSLQRFDEAEKIVKFHNEEILLGKSGDLIAQLLLNDAFVDYHATMTDAIMINTYKAIDYMALGEMDQARIEFNRAIDRQRRAKETYAKMVYKAKQAIKEKEKEEQRNIAQINRKASQSRTPQPQLFMDVDKNTQNPQIQNMISSRYPALDTYTLYPDFVNPFTNYLAGIFFTTQRDYKKADTLLRETHKMLPNNKTVESDYRLVEDILNGKKRRLNNVWIIYANGLAPKKEEFKINIPLYLVTNKVLYTGIALPKMKLQKKATRNLDIFSKNRLLAQTKPFASMDRVILTEFKYRYNDIVYRAVFGALIKTYVQYEARRNGGDLYGLATGFLQMALTKADTRTWTSLPKEYQLAKIKMPKDKKIKLQVGRENIDIDLKDTQNAIVFVRKTTPYAKVSYNMIKL